MIAFHTFRSFAKPAEGSRPSSVMHAVLMIGTLAGCVGDQPEVSETSQAATVSSYLSATCSTAVVLGLSRQIADQISCDNKSWLVPFSPSSNIVLTSSAVLPYLAANAKADLQTVAASRTVQINSAFRTVAQQYLLYRWYQAGRCGIAAAATPGRSNHESGRALDVANWSGLTSAMSANGWAHDVPGDDVHFDHLASVDIRGKDVLAFQKLWNRNNAGDTIAEDGQYGPQTEARLRAAPATGFAIGPSCGSAQVGLDLLAVNGPDRVLPQTRAHYTLTLHNGSDSDWPAAAVLRVTGTTQLHDASWLSTTDITTLGVAVPAHSQAEVAFDVTTPLVAADTPINEQLQLVAGAQPLGNMGLALTVVPNMQEPTSSDGDDQFDQVITGGCSAGSGAGGPLALALVLLGLRRRRPGHPRRLDQPARTSRIH